VKKSEKNEKNEQKFLLKIEFKKKIDECNLMLSIKK